MRVSRITTLIVLTAGIWMTLVPPARAGQEEPADTRAEALLAERRARLAEVEPADDSRIVRMLTTIENDGFDQIFTVQAGDFRFGFGQISPVSGGSPAIHYEQPRLGATPLTLRRAAAYSLRGYQGYELQLGVFDQPAPEPFAGGAFLGAPFDLDKRSVAPLDELLYLDAHYRNFPGEDFFGIGPGSSNADRSRYEIVGSGVDLVAGYQPARWVAVLGRAGILRADIGPGDHDRFPDTEVLFTPATAPGIGEQADFLRVGTGLYAVWAGDPNVPALELGVEGSRHDDREGGRYSFNRLSFDARGFLPLGSRQRTIAVRAFASRDYVDTGAQVPFYLMETLGGQETLRGFRNFRFRDTNVFYLSGEYRWEATAGFDLAVADHSDNMGFFPDLFAGAPHMLADPTGKRWYDLVQEGSGVTAALKIIDRFSRATFPEAMFYGPDSKPYKNAWAKTIAAAEAYNDPGRFTAFIGYEWTSQVPRGNNLHRVIIYRDGADKASQTVPFTTYPPDGSTNPEDLWTVLEAWEEKTGGDVLAIAHNGNLSNGMMFPLVNPVGNEPLTREFAERRARWERPYEVTQMKGDGEAHPFLSPTNEFADFGTWDKGNLNLSELKTDVMLAGEYARSGLKRGLQLEAELGINPFKYGLVGATDSHTALSTADDDKYFDVEDIGDEVEMVHQERAYTSPIWYTL